MLSTTRLAKEQGINGKEAFAKLITAGLIQREGDKWTLTDAGKKSGGEMRFSRQYGEFIVWPSTLRIP